MTIKNFSNQLYVKSLLVQIPQGQSSVNVDMTFTYITIPKGINILLTDCQFGDVGILSLVHPNPQIGILRELGYVHLPTGNRQVDIEEPEEINLNKAVPAGLIYRFHLEAIDTNGRNVIVWLKVRY